MSVALFNQHSMRKRRIILSSVTSQAVQNFSTLSLKRQDFQRKDFGHKIHVLLSYVRPYETLPF
jgi:hypothetical protein